MAYAQSTIFAELPPPLKWAGGKRWLVPRLRTLWDPHQHRRLVEPFVGGMAVALGLQPSRALLNDANIHLINFYQWLQRGLITTIPMHNDMEVYYAHRERFNALIRENRHDSAESASLFYYLNRTGFNGLCRFNRSGFFNVPFGRYKTINYITDFTSYADLLGEWAIQTDDFSTLELDESDFIYADPPYDVEFTAYSPGGFAWDDQVRLAEWLANHHGPVVTSNQATPRIMDLYTALDFDIVVVDAPRYISCDGNRTPAQEIFATKGV